MLTLASPLGNITGIGPTRANALAQAGFLRVGDLLLRMPAAYREPQKPTAVAALRPGIPACVRVVCQRAPSVSYGPRAVRVTGVMRDEAGSSITCCWYGQPYLARRIVKGETYCLFGRPVRRQGQLMLISPAFEDADAQGMLPVYEPVADMRGKTLRNLVRSALDALDDVRDAVPESLRANFDLPGMREALFHAHFPADAAACARALRRVAFENLALFLCSVQQNADKRPGVRIEAGAARLAPFTDALPYAMTGAQRRALADIAADMASGQAMARLVQGDVGCGKTAVAMAALYAAAQAGYQGALMAPTEVLALQHAREAEKVLAPLGVRVGLLTGGMKAAERRLMRGELASGACQVVVGTHALLSEGVEFAALGLVVVDEQHRFGVRQRETLVEGGCGTHMLVLSATPIPRTLALALRGDLKVSLIDEMPPGRGSTRTARVSEAKIPGMLGFLAKIIAEGRQVFAVCPRITEDAEGEAASVEETARLYEASLPGARIGVVHGKMKSAACAAAIDAFRMRQTDVLVATTVIEVGVHLPNALVMVIHDAPSFGLSTLHQLRGRVGRGADDAHCFLLGDEDGELEAFARERDGFAIAQMDLERRGPGELYGVKQHGTTGLPVDGGVLALAAQPEMLDAAQRLAEAWRRENDVEALARARHAFGQGGYAIH